MRNSTILAVSSILLVACDAAGLSGPRGGDTYRVRHGDTLYSIAQRAYGDGLEWERLERLQDHNPWASPDRLEVGELIYIPELEPPGPELARAPSDRVSNPGNGGFWEDRPAPPRNAKPLLSTDVFRNILPGVADKTLFGMSLPRAGSAVLVWFLLHAVLQGFMVWIVANVTFVRDASIKKSLKATFLTESLTVCTLLLVGAVGLMMVYVGAADPGGVAGTELFPSVEEYLSHPIGMAVASFAILFLYVLLSLRFIPQTFEVEMTRGIAVVFLAILLPHLLGFYLVGQRLGLIY